jgi:hypothetical protein
VSEGATSFCPKSNLSSIKMSKFYF